ncbi:MAG: hypothetical protein M3303_15110, partial [Gemmatimonadota bacterium]|nr:hypothetical protein [Gemmatimonadota bacterium]
MSRRPGWYRIRGRFRASLLVSLGIHFAVVAALVNVVFRYDIRSLGVVEDRARATPERLRYVRVAPEPGGGGPAVASQPSIGPTATVRL